jgi:hypothetical protein
MCDCTGWPCSFNEFLTWYTDDGMVSNLLKTYDKDRDGKLSPKEFQALCKDVWALDKKKCGTIMKKFDEDGDGFMGLADLRGMLTQVGNKKMSSSSRSTQETADDFMAESSDDEDAQPPTEVTLPRSMAAAAASDGDGVSREMKKVLGNQSKKQVNVRSLVGSCRYASTSSAVCLTADFCRFPRKSEGTQTTDLTLT